MTRNSNVRSVKPMLEVLEDRALPSFLFTGTAVTQLSQTVSVMVTDMQNQATALQTQYNNLPGLPASQAPNMYAKMASEWTRMWSDHATINVTVTTDITVINTIALTEAAEGDPLDMLIMRFAPLLEQFHLIPEPPLQPLQTPMHTANNMWSTWTTPGTHQYGIVHGDLSSQNSNMNPTPINDNIVTADV